MLCLPYDEVKCSRKKNISMIFVILSVFVLFCCLKTFLLKLVLREPDLHFMIIQTLLVFITLALGTVVYLIRQNHLLREQLSKQQKIVQKFSIQRDIDMLSGLKNRNSFVRMAQQIEKRGDRVSVMVCDIDGLKIINDTLGHIAGDQIIKKVAEILKISFPTSAEIFRIGGDEYLAIIEEVLPEKKIVEIQGKITQQINQYNAIKPTVPLSISFGFACSSLSLCAFEEIVKQADYAMYQEKRVCQEKVHRYITATLSEK